MGPEKSWSAPRNVSMAEETTYRGVRAWSGRSLEDVFNSESEIGLEKAAYQWRSGRWGWGWGSGSVCSTLKRFTVSPCIEGACLSSMC